MRPRRPKMAPRWAKMAPRWTKSATRLPKMAPRWRQDWPRWRQDGLSKRQDGQDGAKTTPRWCEVFSRWPRCSTCYVARSERASAASDASVALQMFLSFQRFCFEFSKFSFCFKLVGHLGGLPCIRKVWIGSNRCYEDMVERSKYLQACVQCTSLPNIITLPVHLPRQVF